MKLQKDKTNLAHSVLFLIAVLMYFDRWEKLLGKRDIYKRSFKYVSIIYLQHHNKYYFTNISKEKKRKYL